MRKLMVLGVVGFVALALLAYGVLTDTNLPENRPGKVIISRSTAVTGAVSESLAPDGAFKLHWVMIHYTASVSTGAFTVTLDSGVDSAYDVLLHSTTLSSTTDIIFQPTRPYYFQDGDEIDVAAPDKTTTYGLTICLERMN
jgi:hypothetical protein